jgi:carbonic anhydrase
VDTIDELLAANAGAPAPAAHDGRPGRRLAIVTCMDARIEPLAALGLDLGQAHVIRNAGARLTDDVRRSLALSTHVLGVNTVVFMQHTRCGLTGTDNEELKRATGAHLDFLPIEDHASALHDDIDQLAGTPYLETVEIIAGLLYDTDTGRAVELARWRRSTG